MTRAVLLASLAFAACEEPPPPPPALATVTIAVNGMHCQGCAMAITEVVEKMGGVSRCEVSLEAKTAEVEIDPARVTAAEIASAIAGLGYHAAMPGEAREAEPPPPAPAEVDEPEPGADEPEQETPAASP